MYLLTAKQIGTKKMNAILNLYFAFLKYHRNTVHVVFHVTSNNIEQTVIKITAALRADIYRP